MSSLFSNLGDGGLCVLEFGSLGRSLSIRHLYKFYVSPLVTLMPVVAHNTASTKFWNTLDNVSISLLRWLCCCWRVKINKWTATRWIFVTLLAFLHNSMSVSWVWWQQFRSECCYCCPTKNIMRIETVRRPSTNRVVVQHAIRHHHLRCCHSIPQTAPSASPAQLLYIIQLLTSRHC